MTLHCPHCGGQFEKGHFPLGDEVTCVHCEKVFHLSRKETIPVQKGPPEEPDPSRVRNTQVTPVPGKAETGGQLAGYVLERELGRGGMGVVFLATQESLGRKVAVKVLPRKLSEDQAFVRRFDREAQSLAKLNHPNIVSILDKGQEEGTYYFVMEYVHGVSLRDILEEKRLTPGEALRIVRQVCDALEYAHEEGVVHRDIKPENILIDRKGNAKIADFGLARLVRGDVKQSRITQSQMVMGSPDYMAPEQREDARQVDHRADLYSLGVVFYEMLTGELPLGNFPPPSQKNLGLDVNIDRIVLKVLDKNPEMRYGRASEVATEIEGLHKGNGGPKANLGLAAAISAEKTKGFLKEVGGFLKEHPWILIPLAPFAVAIAAIMGPFLPALAGVAIPLAIIGWLWHATVMETRLKEQKVGLRAAMRRPWGRHRRAERPDGDETGKAEDRPPGYSAIGPIVFILATLITLALIALTGPLASLIQDEYYALKGEEMIAALSVSLLLALPGIVVLVLSFYARARAKRRKQRGAFFASLAVLLSVINLVGFGTTWEDYNRGYRFWNDLEVRAEVGDKGALTTYEHQLNLLDMHSRNRAAHSLFRADGDAVIPLLGTLLDHPEVRIRYRAAQSLGEKGDGAIPYLMDGLDDPSESVRTSCFRGLLPRLPFRLEKDRYRRPLFEENLPKIQAWWAERTATSGARSKAGGDF